MLRIFRHYISPLALATLVGDLAIIAIVFAVVPQSGLWLGGGPLVPKMLLVGSLALALLQLGELYDTRLPVGRREMIARLLACEMVAALVDAAVGFAIPQVRLGRGAFITIWGTLIAGLVLWRSLWIGPWSHDRMRLRVLVLGTGVIGNVIAGLERTGARPFSVIGFLDDNPNAPDTVPQGHTLLGKIADLGVIVEETQPDLVVVAQLNRRGNFPVQALLDCRLRGTQVEDWPTFYEKETGKILVTDLRPSWLIFSDGFVKTSRTETIKRVADLILAMVGLTLALPVMAAVALAIKLDSPGPVLFRQSRLGKNGSVFILNKFRSMREDAEAGTGPVWAQEDDPRVTRVGRILRKLRLDELPQLLNVLVGDMSFIGPRPERPEFVYQLQKQIPFYMARLSVKPGVTGWAQVRYRYGASVEDALEKLQYDLYYIKNLSLFLDLLVLINTVQVVLFAREGAEPLPPQRQTEGDEIDMDIMNIVKQVTRSVLARRKKWVLLVTAVAIAIFVPVAWLISKEPPRYRTSALILIESRPAGGTALPFQEWSPYRPLAVQLAILRSRSLAESVIEALPRASIEDLIDNPYSPDPTLEMHNWVRRLRGEEIVVESPQRRAVQELQSSRVVFYPQGPTGIVQIAAEASKPRVALDIANTYIEVLLARTRSFNIDDTKVSRDFLEQQQAQVMQSLQVSEGSLRQFTIARGGIKPPARNAETVNRLAQIEATLAEIQANKNMSQSRLTAMKAKLEAMPVPKDTPRAAVAAAPAPAQSARVQRLRAKLSALEAQLLEFETKYTSEHPRMALTRQQIDDVRKELGDAVKETTPVPTAASSGIPAADRSAFVETVAALETSVLSLSAQEEALREQGNALRRSLTGLSKDEMDFAKLSSDVDTNRRLHAMLADKLTGVRMREQGEMKVVKVIDPPHVPFQGFNQKRFKYMGVAMLLALAVGIGLPGVVEYFNRPVESEADIRQLTGLPVLAALPLIRTRRPVFMTGKNQAEDVDAEEHFMFTEAFRKLRVEIQLLGRETPLKRLLISSALPGEGKSTVVVNLGLAFGEVGKHVILADADFHRPTLHRTLRTPNTKGFSDLLAGTGDLHDSLTTVAEGVRLAPRGTSSTALSRSGLGSARLPQVIDQMSNEADYVILDSSPTLLIPDNLYMASVADGVILVVHAGTTRPRDLIRTKEIFDKSGTPILGVVLNQLKMNRMKQYQTYYKYYRSYVKADAKS